MREVNMIGECGDSSAPMNAAITSRESEFSKNWSIIGAKTAKTCNDK